MEPTAEEAANVRRALKRLRAEPVAWEPVTTESHTPARRWIVALADGRRVFVKVATDELTAAWIRDEHLVYSMLRGAGFLPAYVGFSDDGARPVIALEDLSAAAWPPPWTRPRVDAVLATLDLIHHARAPEGLPRADDPHLGLRDGWTEVARGPDAFLRLGLCSAEWLEGNLGNLRAAAEGAPLEGEALLHFDVRSDNLCFREDGHAVLVDWNWASIGNPWIDLATWLPSLHAEGGPPPEDVAPGVPPGLAALVAGFFCAHAARPPLPSAPHVRGLQLRQARTALPWAARGLGLPAPE